MIHIREIYSNSIYKECYNLAFLLTASINFDKYKYNKLHDKKLDLLHRDIIYISIGKLQLQYINF